MDLETLMGMDPDEWEKYLATMDHHSLLQLRAKAGKNQKLQDQISPYEHRAFARESAADNPWMALPLAVSTLAYQPYKMITGRSRSKPSLDQLLQGFTGIGEGLKSRF
jgi:hypothetical protein